MLDRLAIVLVLCACCGVARAESLVLANGDTLNGTIVSWDVDSVVLDHPQLGTVRIALEELQIDTGTPPTPGLFGTRFLRGWKRSIDIGMNGKQGNSVSSNLTVGFDFNYDDEFKRWSFRGRYFLNRDGDAVTDNNGQLDLRRDWLIPESPWFGRTSFRYQYDKFEPWVHRTTFLAAPGYHVLEEEKHKVDTLLGLAVTREFGTRKQSKGEGMFGLDYSWTPLERLSLRFSNQFFVQFVPNAGEIRNLTEAEWRLALLEEPALSLRLGAQNEYETDLDPGDKANDFKYWLTMGLDF